MAEPRFFSVWDDQNCETRIVGQRGHATVPGELVFRDVESSHPIVFVAFAVGSWTRIIEYAERWADGA